MVYRYKTDDCHSGAAALVVFVNEASADDVPVQPRSQQLGGCDRPPLALGNLSESKTVLAQVLRPGAYRCVCVELEVHHLAVAAVHAADALGALEGGDDGGAR